MSWFLLDYLTLNSLKAEQQMILNEEAMLDLTVQLATLQISNLLSIFQYISNASELLFQV